MKLQEYGHKTYYTRSAPLEYTIYRVIHGWCYYITKAESVSKIIQYWGQDPGNKLIPLTHKDTELEAQLISSYITKKSA